MKSFKQIKQRIKGAADPVAADGMAPLPHIELLSNRTALVCGCRGVSGYEEDSVSLQCDELCVRFSGSGLTIQSLDGDVSVLSGEIMSVEFFS